MNTVRAASVTKSGNPLRVKSHMGLPLRVMALSVGAGPAREQLFRGHGPLLQCTVLKNEVAA